MNMEYSEIPKEMFRLVPISEVAGDDAPRTRVRGYFADALSRFRKNRSSVLAAVIIGVLILFAILSPILSPYSVYDKDTVYQSYPPFTQWGSALGIRGFLDGSVLRSSQNSLQLDRLRAIGEETGYDPIIGEPVAKQSEVMWRGESRTTYSYRVRLNRYFEKGIVYSLLSEDEFESIQAWQNESGVQVIYPYVRQSDVYSEVDGAEIYSKRDPNIWYKLADRRGNALLDADGRRISAYLTEKELEGAPYHSLRIEADNGDFVYSVERSGALEVRLCYYNYYLYLNGRAPSYPFGTDEFGRDLFCALGTGARFSLLFALFVSFINLVIGVIYGAVEGYYGGAIDLSLDRFSDILRGVPFIVVATLFQLHLAGRVGIVPSFLFAFVLTGWIGMAALTRKQFYRFKGQEYVLASRTLGARDARLMFKHILPNSVGTIITGSVLLIPGVIASEATLTYLGIVNLSGFSGTSIGELMASGQQSMTSAPHTMLFPALFVSLLLISFNLFGNGLRDAFNPSSRGEGE